MNSQVTRHNHYVPEWYQRGFLQPGESKLQYLDLIPEQRLLADGRKVTMNNLSKRGPKGCFQEYDLYSTHFGTTVNDEVERFLFGPIDVRGAKAIRAFVANDPSAMHDTFKDFFEFIDAQKLRTPKGLHWIKEGYGSLDQVQLMIEMQGLRFMHCTMWTEGVREIVSAEDSDVKFIVSDHPVTLYNAAAIPTTPDYAYPNDPPLEWIGTQTIFVLDPNTCLILTHLEYAQNPEGTKLTSPRTNARYGGSSLVRTDAFIRSRKLSEAEVSAINYLLKSRARRFLAASNKEWLYPEKSFTGEWTSLAQILLPKDDLWRFGGEIYVGYEGGKSSYQDAFGRTSRAHEYLRHKGQKPAPRPNDSCGCGSGRKFKRCCRDLSTDERPTWEFFSIRERNLLFCHAVQDILGLNAGKSWQDVRREISDDQVKSIHEAYGSLWPTDTDLPSLLPRPKSGILRTVFLGISDPRLINATVLGWLSYFDEIVLANPFVNPIRITPAYSPTLSPSQYKEQTLKNVFLLLMLEPFIDAGYVHLIPDPADFDTRFATTVYQMAKERTANWERPKHMEDWQKIIAGDDYQRTFWRGPEVSLRRFVRKEMPAASETDINSVIAYAKARLVSDPYALLQPTELREVGAQLHSVKGFNLETGMFIASLTGSSVYTNSETHWQHLHFYAQGIRDTQSVRFVSKIEILAQAELSIDIDIPTLFEALRNGRFRKIKHKIKSFSEALERPSEPLGPHEVAVEISEVTQLAQDMWIKIPAGHRLSGRVELSRPAAGFDRTEVRRLQMTFGRIRSARPISLAMLIKFETEDAHAGVTTFNQA